LRHLNQRKEVYLSRLTLSVLGGYPTVISTGTRWITLKDCKSHCFGRDLQQYYSPADWARELFKPSMAHVSNWWPLGQMWPAISFYVDCEA